MSKHKWIVAVAITVFVLAGLACAPCGFLQQVQELGEAGKEISKAAEEGNIGVTVQAWEKLTEKGDYQATSRFASQTSSQPPQTGTITEERDANGNYHLIVQGEAGEKSEIYIVGGRTYVWSEDEKTYLNLGQTASEEEATAMAGAGFGWLAFSQIFLQASSSAKEVGTETVAGRQATKYELTFLLGALSKALGGEEAKDVDLSGTAWVDRETGILLKMDTTLVNKETNERTEYHFEVNRIGGVPAIQSPSPVKSLLPTPPSE